MGDLAAAVRDRGMRFATYYSGGQDWTFTGLPLQDLQAFFNGCPDTTQCARYADAHWRELIDRYQPPILWNDYSYPSDANAPALIEHYRQQVPDGLVNDRFQPPGASADDPGATVFDFHTPEQTTAGE